VERGWLSIRESVKAGIRLAWRLPFLCLGDLAALDAAGADPDPLGMAVYQSLYSLQVHAPTAAGDVVCVRDIIAKLRAFAANVAYLCHDFAPNFVVLRAARSADSSATIKALNSGLFAGFLRRGV
jgi:hypothetical protein